MRKISCSLVLFLSLTQLTFSQLGYEPFSKSDKFWFYNILNSDDTNPAIVGAFVVWTKGDTIINNQPYIKVFVSGLSGSHPCQFPPCFVPDIPYVLGSGGLIGFIRDDTVSRKVFYKKINLDWNDCVDEEIELYDFSETVDSIPNCLRSKILNYWGEQDFGIIDSITLSEVFNKERKIFHFQAPYLFSGSAYLKDMQIIEGIGSTFYNQFTQFENTHFTGFCEGTPGYCNIITAETEKSEFKIGDIWSYAAWIDGDCEERPLYDIGVIKDTVIENKLYNVIAKKINAGYVENSKVYLFKKDHKVMFWDNGQDYLLYDFSLKKGDTLNYYVPSNIHYFDSPSIANITYDYPVQQKLAVQKIDTIISFNGIPLKRFHTDFIDLGNEICINQGMIIEGIGSTLSMFGYGCYVVATGCHNTIVSFYSDSLAYYNPDNISQSEYNINTNWKYTPWDLTPTEKIYEIKVLEEKLINGKLCNLITIVKNNIVVENSKFYIYYGDSMVQFFDGQKFKTLYDFRQKNIGDTVKYYLPWNAKYYDISSAQGQFSADTNAYFYKVTGIENIVSDEGTVLKKYEIDNIYDEFSCYTMGNQIIESIGSTSGYLGRPCMQLTGGFPEYFRCFKSDHLNYNALDKDCDLTSIVELISEIKVYPNPVQNTLSIGTDIIYDNTSVIDVNGKILINTNSASKEIDVSALNNGIYILSLKNRNQVLGKTKIVILK